MGSRVVHHYPVGTVMQRVHVPAGSRIVSAAMRQGLPVICVEKPEGEPRMVPMDAVFVGTGQPFGGDLDHVDTLLDGPFVWHVYGAITS